jgi:hypothetical protein
MEQSLQEDNMNECVYYEEELWLSGLLNCQMAADISMDKTWNHQLPADISVSATDSALLLQANCICCLVSKLLTPLSIFHSYSRLVLEVCHSYQSMPVD